MDKQPAVIIGYVEDILLAGRVQKKARQAVAAGALLICADSGGEAARSWGLVPDWLVGDMDSIQPTTLSVFQANPAVKVRVAPVEKDETDLELALVTALEAGATDITILGGLGGRLDHTLGNLYLLASPRLIGVTVRIIGEREEVYLLRGGEQLTLAGQPGELLSLIPLSNRTEGVRTEGLYYPLRGEPLLLGPTRGVSNQFVGQSASLSFEDGLLLVIHSFGQLKPDPTPQ